MLLHGLVGFFLPVAISGQELQDLLLVPEIAINIKFVLEQIFIELGKLALFELVMLDLPVIVESSAVFIEARLLLFV